MENRFGLFVHWGLYAIPAVHEQVLINGNWPHEAYEALARRFNPTQFDAEAWVKAAKNAGMRYICVTAKHHDGFCMWDTKQTDYSVMRTPYGKDIIGMFAEACHKHGMLFSVYYSIPDWHHPNAYNPLSSHQWKAKSPELADMGAYVDYIKMVAGEDHVAKTKYTSIFRIPVDDYADEPIVIKAEEA